MFRKKEYPILEFDEDSVAIINPIVLKEKFDDIPHKLIITFFKDAIDRLLADHKIEHLVTIPGENDFIVYKFTDADIAIIHGVVGGPACGGHLDELIGLGVDEIIFCGGGGVLRKDIAVGKLIVVDGSIRDDGFSYHYAKPSRIIYADKNVENEICSYLDELGISYLKGLTWTTDAFYRETKSKIELRKSEGALIVEMEQAGCIAVSQFRNIKYGAIIYGGDDVSGEVWDKRNWGDRKDSRYSLVMLCYEYFNR